MMTSSEELPITIEELNAVVSIKGDKPTKGSLVFGSEGYLEGAMLCINNHSGYRTGCSSGSPSATSSSTCANEYNVVGSGTGASTTGTIYGIYDMSGGAWDRLMGNLNKMSGYTAISYTAEQAKTILGRVDNGTVGIWNSGFNGPVYGKALDGVTTLGYTSGIPFPNEKYYDLYTTTNKNMACKGSKCIGDGTTETQGWYGDSNIFVSSIFSWFYRGGYQGNVAEAGIFAITGSYGNESSGYSFRVVLSAD